MTLCQRCLKNLMSSMIDWNNISYEAGMYNIQGTSPFIFTFVAPTDINSNNGNIIIAIENRYGMKYWAGCREDHNGEFFSGIENYQENIFYSIVPILTLLVLQISLSSLSLKFPRFRIFLDGNPSVMIQNGRINYREMVKQKYNLDDLLVQLRDKGYRSIEEVEYAILENSGTLSVFPYSKDNKKTTIFYYVNGSEYNNQDTEFVFKEKDN